MEDQQIAFEKDIENDPEVQEAVSQALAKIDEEQRKIDDRVSLMDMIHEDLIIIDKIDVRSMKTFLHLAQKDKDASVRTSYHGRVVSISSVDSHDDVKESKKAKLKPGNIISFNPDCGYSLNVTVPEDMPTIWVLSVDNVLVSDRGFDIRASKKKTVIADVILSRIRAHQARVAMEMAHKKKEEKGQVITGR
jgi:hypothetical protein